MTLTSRFLGLWAFALVLSGCPKLAPEDDDSDTADDMQESAPPVESQRRLDQLERSELQAFCLDLNTELSMRFDNRRLASYACTRTYIQRGDSLTCNLNVDDCLRQSPAASLAAPRPADFQIDNSECVAIGACRVSVADFDTCISARFDQSEQLLARVSCSLANDPQAVEDLLQQIDAPRRVPQSCASVAANCPGLL